MLEIKLDLELFKAKFISEGHNRFIALVEFQGEIIECYVPSSSKLAHFVNLNSKEVIISKNKVARRTQYTLFAVSYYNKYIMLNLNLVNHYLAKYLSELSLYEEINLERKYNDYKTDIMLRNSNNEIMIIEAKGLIGVNRTISFPFNKSDRAIQQLIKIREILKTGNKVGYYFISLSPIIKKIVINDIHSEFKSLLYDCVNLNMEIHCLSFEFIAEKNSILVNKIKLDM